MIEGERRICEELVGVWVPDLVLGAFAHLFMSTNNNIVIYILKQFICSIVFIEF